MARMIRDGSGIVCLTITDDLADHLELPPMVQDNSSQFKTAFTITIEAAQGAFLQKTVPLLFMLQLKQVLSQAI
ncbi:unnamed protein product [Oppiella nova]|uniref:3,4-dihydroxy-2-butanone-4-phosphate synthase n=1 Tax=Oppiella nova TaxID=334625 RepID=A0A7R9L7R7_9ACAR|nr:unnamed protein product [Oppiella nova]CAG2157719.1 unnamed protein product [Oppiella nova]